MKWSEEEIKKLKLLWPTASNIQIIEETFPNRTWPSIWLKAASLGLKAFQRNRKGNLEPLLNNSPEAWYWLGFFLADGHITKDGNFVVTIQKKDEYHLQKLADFLSLKIKNIKKSTTINGTTRFHIRVETMNADVCNKIKDIFGLEGTRKTENPPTKLYGLSKDQLDYVFIGFFDGDGCMRRKGYGQFGCHKNWLPVFDFFQKCGLLQSVKLSKQDKVTGTVPVSVIKRLNSLPVPKMERKWIWSKT